MRTRLFAFLFLFLLLMGGCGKKEKSTDELIADLKAGEKERIIAARLLPHHKGDAARVVPALITALKDKDSDVRRSAVLGLGSFGEQAKEAVSALQELYRVERDARVRASTYHSLEKIDPTAVPKTTEHASAGQ
jgi:HEAT repeat protein